MKPHLAPIPAGPNETHPAMRLAELVARMVTAIIGPWWAWGLLPGGRAMAAQLRGFAEAFTALMRDIASLPPGAALPVPALPVPARKPAMGRQRAPGAPRPTRTARAVRPRRAVAPRARATSHRTATRPAYRPTADGLPTAPSPAIALRRRR